MKLTAFNDGILFFIILSTSIIMAIAMVFYRKKTGRGRGRGPVSVTSNTKDTKNHKRTQKKLFLLCSLWFFVSFVLLLFQKSKGSLQKDQIFCNTLIFAEQSRWFNIVEYRFKSLMGVLVIAVAG